jgi:peptidoglycan/xylan/chitin deacetylase (PgdA/CDA1 family)
VKRVTLTFDNGPSPETTPGVLDELQKRNLRARFCVVGAQLKEPAGAALARRALDEGHLIVNHSLTHTVPLGDDDRYENAAREIGEMHDLMCEKLGDWGDKWFRPFGRGGKLGPHIFSAAALDQLAAREYSVLLWNSVPEDWINPEGWPETALEHMRARDHTVVVLHDVPTGAMAQLPRFLDQLEDEGAETTQDLPADVVPFRHGEAQHDLTNLTKQ